MPRRQRPSVKRLRKERIERQRIANLPDADFIWEGEYEDKRIVGFTTGLANLPLACNGIPGFGGLNRMFLGEEGWYTERNTVEVIEPITRSGGRIKLPSGYELNITMRDVRLDQMMVI